MSTDPNKMREEKSADKARNYAEDLFDYFLYRKKFDASAQKILTDWLTKDEIIKYSDECFEKINNFTDKMTKRGFNQYSLLGASFNKSKKISEINPTLSCG